MIGGQQVRQIISVLLGIALCIITLFGCSSDGGGSASDNPSGGSIPVVPPGPPSSGGGSTGESPPGGPPPSQGPTRVRITGRVDDGLPRSPIAQAICRMVNIRGTELGITTAGTDGVYSLDIAPGEQGFIECHPPGLSGLLLTTFVSTVNVTPGQTLLEGITPTTFVIDSILRRTNPQDPQTAKTRLLTSLEDQRASLHLLVDAMTILFNVLLEVRLDTDLEAAWTDLTADGILDAPALQSVTANVRQALRSAEQRRQSTVGQVFTQLTGGALPTQVLVEGTVRSGASSIAHALCSFTDQQGRLLDAVMADTDGVFRLELPPNVQGFIRCHPPALPNLGLSAVLSTNGRIPGELVPQEDVTPVTTLIASLLSAEAPTNLQARAEVLRTVLTVDNPSAAIIIEGTTILYLVLLENQVNINFDGSGDGGSGSGSSDSGGGSGPGASDGGGAGGGVSDGVDAASPIPNAVCEFALRMGDRVLTNAALADLLTDGSIDRPDLQAIATGINQQFATRTAAVTTAFANLFPGGIGQPLRTIADGPDSPTPGRYFLPTPPGVPGFVRCHPPDAGNLVLSTFVRARQLGETLVEQNVTPGSTVISNAIIAAQQADPALNPVTIQQALADAVDFRIFPAEDVNSNGVLDPGEDIDGSGVLEVVPHVVPLSPQVPLANTDVALLVLTATTTFNAMRATPTLPPIITFQDAVNDFFSDGSFRTELAPIAPVVQDTILAPVNQEVLGTQDVIQAATTGTLRGTITDTSGRPLAGVRVIVAQAGAEVENTATNIDGMFTLHTIPAGASTITASFRGFAPATRLVTVVAVAIIDVNLTLSPLPLFADFSDVTQLSLIGDATQHDGVLRLRGGIAWFVAQQMVQDGFETTFQFRITEVTGNLDCEGRPGADGFAFVLQNQSVTAAGAGGGNLGYGFLPNSLAIEFDTWCNADIGDPNGNHISVHTRGIDPNSAEQAFALATATSLPDMSDGLTHTVMITYVPGTLRVFLDDLVTPVLQVPINLATTLRLNDGHAWVGFTAGVAGGSENHDIHAWSFTEGSGQMPEFVTLRSPADGACASLAVTWQWNIDNPLPGQTYCSDVLTDKGQNPYDGNREDLFAAGQSTALAVSLDPVRYDPASLEWGVRVTACDTPGATCPCQGVSFVSEIRRLRTTATGENCPP